MRTKLDNGSVFVSYQENDTDEVYGWCETAAGQLISGSGGWWRTLEHAEAARMANLLYGRPVPCTVPCTVPVNALGV